MRISARADYALRAALELAAAQAVGERPVPAAVLAAAQDVPQPFLEGILRELRRAGLVVSRRGTDGGYLLAGPASGTSVADVVRAVDGPLVNVQDARPSEVRYGGAAAGLLTVWVALRANVRAVLEVATLADVARGDLPAEVVRLAEGPGAWDDA